MKKALLVFVLLLTTFANAQLNSKSKYYKSKAPDLYKAIKTEAIREWETDNKMIVYFINKQCDALYTLINEKPYQDYIKAKDGEKRIAFNKILSKWTTNGFTDWRMIVYSIKKREENSDY